MSRREAILVAAGIIALAGLVIVAFFAAAPVLQGWLLALIFWSSIAIGALALILIHRLTGGLWGREMAPILAPAALTVPFFALLFVPVVVWLGHVYVWAGDPSVVKADVVDHYLNLSGYALRGLLAFVGWSLTAVLVLRFGAGILVAALALAFYGLLISVVSVDWVLSTDPHFTSTAFGAEFAVQQLLAALAFTALFAPFIASARVRQDLGQLLIATIVGEFYLALMTLIVFWYGDQPNEAHWYLVRVRGGWQWVILAAFLLGAAIPFLALLQEERRRSATWLRVVGASVLAGVLLHIAWWMGPTFAPYAMLAAGGAVVAVGAGFLLIWRRIGAAPRIALAESGHG